MLDISKEIPITVKQGFEHYLKLVDLDEEVVSEVQMIETKRAFYAGCGMAFLMLQDLTTSPMELAIQKLQMLRNEVADFYNNEN